MDYNQTKEMCIAIQTVADAIKLQAVAIDNLSQTIRDVIPRGNDLTLAIRRGLFGDSAAPHTDIREVLM